MLFLVRHGRPLVDRRRPAHEWRLHPDALGEVLALRDSGRLPSAAGWFSSPEPKAIQTARLLTDCDITVVDDLRELERHNRDWIEDFNQVVERAFAHPAAPAYDGWEPLERCAARVHRVARELMARTDGDVVLVGHGTAWSVLVAELTGTEPDLGRWAALGMPDVLTVKDVIGWP